MNNSDRFLMMQQRRILGWLCIALPLLAIGFAMIGWLVGVNYDGWFESISATYYANSKMMMIGVLCATGIYFWAYEGYDKVDNIVTCISAIAAFCVVIFPCSDAIKHNEEQFVGLFCLPVKISGVIHNLSAGVLYTTFLIMVARFLKSNGEKTKKKVVRNIIYVLCLLLMVAGVIFIALQFVCAHYFIAIGECFLNFAYGFAWLVKSELIKCLND